MTGPHDIRAASKAILKDGKIVEADPISLAQAALDASDASALVTGDMEPGSRIRGNRAALIQGAAEGTGKAVCRIEVAGDVVIEGGAEHAQVSGRRIWVGGPVQDCQLVAQDGIVLLDNVSDSELVTGELSAEKRRIQALKERVRKAEDKAATLERQLAVNQKRLGSAVERSSFEFKFSAGHICSLSRDRIRIDLAPFYKMLEGKSDSQVDRALLEFFTKGVVGYLARVNRKQILDNPSRQKVFVTLTRSLHEVFLQTRERDKHCAVAQRTTGELVELRAAVRNRDCWMHIGGEILPGTELRFSTAMLDVEGDIEAVTAGIAVHQGPDEDHRQVLHIGPKGREDEQVVAADVLQGTTLKLVDGRVVWER